MYFWPLGEEPAGAWLFGTVPSGGLSGREIRKPCACTGQPVESMALSVSVRPRQAAPPFHGMGNPIIN